MTPEDTLKKTEAYLKNLEKAKGLYVAVGITKSEASGKIYKDGSTVVEVGAGHEFGIGRLPQRSFLRVPFKIKAKDVEDLLLRGFRGVAENGKDAESQLGIVGMGLENISKEAFETMGYGTWKDISKITKAAKSSSAILVDTGILRGSISSEVRNAS